MTAFLWKLSWKNSKVDEMDHVFMYSCVLVILLRYVFSSFQAFIISAVHMNLFLMLL